MKIVSTKDRQGSIDFSALGEIQWIQRADNRLTCGFVECPAGLPSTVMRRNVRLIIAYEGTDFHGWQAQPGWRTVQGVLEEAARRVVKHPVQLIGSGRTDAGVHAVGQVANFVTDCRVPTDRIARAITARLPDDVAVHSSDEVSPAFHATRCATSKMYRYRIHNADQRPVGRLVHRYVYHCWHPLDVERMRAGAAHMIGEMDFSAMASAGCVRETMVRRVIGCDISRDGDEVSIDVTGTGFLYNQVRNMVGTLIEVGRGHWPADRVAEVMASRDRSNAGPTAPALGLCLQWVRYPESLLVPPVHEDGATQAP